MKHELVRWLCIELNISMVMGVKGQGNPSSQGGWKTIIE